MLTVEGSLIRSARKARGWSQARLIGALRDQAARDRITLMSPASLRVALSRWENGHTAPDDAHSRLLSRTLEIVPGDPVVASSATFDGPADGSLFATLTNHTNSLRLLDRRLGAPLVRTQTATHVTALEAMWRTANGNDQRCIAQAQSDTAALAAWQDLDVGDQVSAARNYAIARRAASRAGDPILLAHAIGEHAILLAESGHATTAMAQVTQAETFPGLPALLRSWLAATRAQVSTANPGGALAAREALTSAEAHLALSLPGDEVNLPFISLNAVHMQRWQGHVLVRLGDPAGVATCRSALEQMPGEFVRAHSAQILDLAEGALGAGEFEEASSLLSGSIDRIAQLGSGRLRRRHDLLTRRVRSGPAAV